MRDLCNSNAQSSLSRTSGRSGLPSRVLWRNQRRGILLSLKRSKQKRPKGPSTGAPLQDSHADDRDYQLDALISPQSFHPDEVGLSMGPTTDPPNAPPANAALANERPTQFVFTGSTVAEFTSPARELNQVPPLAEEPHISLMIEAIGVLKRELKWKTENDEPFTQEEKDIILEVLNHLLESGEDNVGMVILGTKLRPKLFFAAPTKRKNDSKKDTGPTVSVVREILKIITKMCKESNIDPSELTKSMVQGFPPWRDPRNTDEEAKKTTHRPLAI
jgi:hypothetical protein